MKSNLNKKNILVVGDLMLDKYVRGSVSRISPEAPVPILSKDSSEYKLGGCANVAKNLTALGANVWIVGKIGEDIEGSIVSELLQKKGININLLIADKNVVTTQKTRYISGNQHLLRVDREHICFNNFKLDVIKEDLERHARYFDAIIVSDYDKGMINVELAEFLGKLALKKNKIITVDTKKADVSCFANYTSITPNLKELSKIFNTNITDYKASFELAHKLLAEYCFENVLITLSENGLYYADNFIGNHLKAEKQEIVDVTGCGDTIISTFTLALANGLGLEMSANIANITAGIVALKSGAESCSLDELDDNS